MSSSGAPAISLGSVSKRYGDGVVLDAISLDVHEGEFLTLLGPSGSGKTTILNIIAGFIAPNSGTLRFGEQDMTSVPPHLRGIGVVFQSYALFPHMTVAENVAFPLKARRVAKTEIDTRVEWALSLVKLAGFRARRIDQLSGGQKQRVALARAMVFKPKLILMDEPLSALDKQLREQMQIEIRALHEQLGATTVYVTHDQREALTMSHRIAVLNHGRITQLDTPEAIYDRPIDAFVADFIGEAVLVPVTKTGTHTVSLRGYELRSSNTIPDGQDSVLVIRSEKLRLAGPGQGQNRFPAKVKERVFQGESMLFLLELEGGTICTFRQPTHIENAGGMPSPGAEITLSLHPNHTLVVPAEARG